MLQQLSLLGAEAFPVKVHQENMSLLNITMKLLQFRAFRKVVLHCSHKKQLTE